MKKVINTVFADFTQNNSGGYFIIDEEKGIGHYIVVEGVDAKDIETDNKVRELLEEVEIQL